jgi:GMP synthase (glutamine-hydrolysing)
VEIANVYILQNIGCEIPGIISDCLKATGISIHNIRAFEGQQIPPAMNAAAGLVVMGGPMGVYEQQRFPFLLDEQRLVEQALKEDKPVLGICLGSQLLASTLGAEVRKGEQKEIGWHRVALIEDTAETDSLWKGVVPFFTAFHWHGDIFTLPEGAVSLVYSELTSCQGFRYGKAAYGFLFHMEVTEKIIKDMVATFRSELGEEKISGAALIRKAGDHLQRLTCIGKRVFQRWAGLVRIG